jgi:hypothetical protein
MIALPMEVLRFFAVMSNQTREFGSSRLNRTSGLELLGTQGSKWPEGRAP